LLDSPSENRPPLAEAAQCADLGKHSSQCC
jgi:hypothetical protein